MGYLHSRMVQKPNHATIHSKTCVPHIRTPLLTSYHSPGVDTVWVICALQDWKVLRSPITTTIRVESRLKLPIKPRRAAGTHVEWMVPRCVADNGRVPGSLACKFKLKVQGAIAFHCVDTNANQARTVRSVATFAHPCEVACLASLVTHWEN